MSSSSAVKIPSSFIEALIKLTVEPSEHSPSEEIKLSTIVICDGFSSKDKTRLLPTNPAPITRILESSNLARHYFLSGGVR